MHTTVTLSSVCSGFSRSVGGLGVANSTAALLAVGGAANLSTVLTDPAAVLAAMQSTWGGTDVPAPSSHAPPFSLTLSSAAPLVLRSALPAFSANASVLIGGRVCNASAVAADGRWLAFTAPSPAAVCGGKSMASCSYATIVVSNPPRGEIQGAALSCPPFCSGTLGPTSGVVPLVSSAGSVVLPAALQPSGLVTPLTADDYASGSSPSGGALPAYPSGLYYAEACSVAGIYTDPSTGACTNASDPRFPFCAFGGGDGCVPCPGGAVCPGGFRCWPLAGYYVPVEGSTAVQKCGAPSAATRCVGWSTALGQTRCGAGYLQVCVVCL